MGVCGSNHDLVEIHRSGYENHEQEVVRWCKDCGAVVVDGEYDNRVYPGKIMPMIVPDAASK